VFGEESGSADGRAGNLRVLKRRRQAAPNEREHVFGEESGSTDETGADESF
jgi:hypothetical protein